MKGMLVKMAHSKLVMAVVGIKLGIVPVAFRGMAVGTLVRIIGLNPAAIANALIALIGITCLVSGVCGLFAVPLARRR